MTQKKRALTGIRATGELHIGNYLGTIKEGLKLQDRYQCFYFIADLHSLNGTVAPAELHSQTLDIAAAWLALGLNDEEHLIYRQSDIPQVTEFSWYLSCVTGMGHLQKAHSYKDAISNNVEVNHGVFAYPLLMAADILMYEPDVVPVGKDQKQHVEMARDMAGSFNAKYRVKNGEEILKLPTPLINEEVMTIPGLDGRKMSKSYGNQIPIFSTEKKLRKKIMSVKTDSSGQEEPKELNDTLVGQLYNLFATPEQYRELRKKLAAGGMGWGHAKEELFVAVNSELSEARERYFAIRADEKELNARLERGREKALDICSPILNKVRQAQGLQAL